MEQHPRRRMSSLAGIQHLSDNLLHVLTIPENHVTAASEYSVPLETRARLSRYSCHWERVKIKGAQDRISVAWR
jgi:hypothetical protein